MAPEAVEELLGVPDDSFASEGGGLRILYEQQQDNVSRQLEVKFIDYALSEWAYVERGPGDTALPLEPAKGGNTEPSPSPPVEPADLYRSIRFGDSKTEILTKIGDKPLADRDDSLGFNASINGQECIRVLLFHDGGMARMALACSFDILYLPAAERALATGRFLLEALSEKYGFPSVTVQQRLTSYDTTDARALQVGKYRFVHQWQLPAVQITLSIEPDESSADVRVLYDNPARPWSDIAKEGLKNDL